MSNSLCSPTKDYAKFSFECRFRKLLSKATFERKLSNVSPIPLARRNLKDSKLVDVGLTAGVLTVSLFISLVFKILSVECSKLPTK